MTEENGTKDFQQSTATVKENLEKSDTFYRIFGLVLIVAGAVCAKFFIFDFLESVRTAHSAAVLIHTNLVMLAPVVLTVGLILLIGAGNAVRAMRERRREGWKFKHMLVALVYLLPTFGVQMWVDDQLKKMGYTTETR